MDQTSICATVKFTQKTFYIWGTISNNRWSDYGNDGCRFRVRAYDAATHLKVAVYLASCYFQSESESRAWSSSSISGIGKRKRAATPVIWSNSEEINNQDWSCRRKLQLIFSMLYWSLYSLPLQLHPWILNTQDDMTFLPHVCVFWSLIHDPNYTW